MLIYERVNFPLRLDFMAAQAHPESRLPATELVKGLPSRQRLPHDVHKYGCKPTQVEIWGPYNCWVAIRQIIARGEQMYMDVHSTDIVNHSLTMCVYIYI